MRRGSRMAVPAGLIAGLVWLMVGCVYLPTPEQVRLTGTARDFRPLAGWRADLTRPDLVGHLTRRQVVDLLGLPPYVSRDGRTVAYTMSTRRGLWLAPVCLAVGSGHESLVAVRFDYGPGDVVSDYRLITHEHDLHVPFVIISDDEGRKNPSEYYTDPYDALRDVNDDGRLANAPTPVRAGTGALP